jgi:putative transcriptional regulator
MGEPHMQASSLAPGFLLAMPQLEDPNFSRAVVLMLEHNEQGSFGLVVNQPSPIKVADLLKTLEMTWKGPEADRVLTGGPVSRTTGWVLHEPVEAWHQPRAGGGTVLVVPGLALSTSPKRLRAIAAAPPPRVRVLLGYSGWAPGQLASEMSRGSWIHADVDPQLLFDTAPDELWARAIEAAGIANPESLVQSVGVN